ncbi:lipoxygenase, partial [Genlisea aurea]
VVEAMAGTLCGRIAADPGAKIKGRVVVMKKGLVDVTDGPGGLLYSRYYKFLRRGVSLRFISSTHGDPENDSKGKVSREAYLEDWILKFPSLAPQSETTLDISVEWDEESMGVPGAFIVKNLHHEQFFLKTVTLDDVPGVGHLHFVCNSWIYPAHRYQYDRIFFSNKTYLPDDTPPPLKWYREEELSILRGKGAGEVPMMWDRVYDYACYNDLGDPDRGRDYVRPVLGGTTDFPYPRRQMTGRRPSKADPRTESRLFFANIDVYVPRDERFSSIKFSDFIADTVKSLGQLVPPEVKAAFHKTPNEFGTFSHIDDLYDGGIPIPDVSVGISRYIPCEFFRELFRSDADYLLHYPVPDVIKEDRRAWRSDEEFCREMLAGVNPAVIQRLTDFPPKSKLPPLLFGGQSSTIKNHNIEPFMNGLTVEQAVKDGKLYVLDHHDTFVPYMTRINRTETKTHASRTLLLLQDDGTLKPIAIELSLPHTTGNQYGSFSSIYTPEDQTRWHLAKAYVAVNDSGHHQLVSHWLHTHAVMEPFIIATNRRLSAMHPVHKLLKPHLRDTMHINALARQILINAGGLLESTVFPGKYAMELTSMVYKSWNFNEQALPVDLRKR